MRKLIDRIFNKEPGDTTEHLAAEAQLSLEYSRLDKRLLSVCFGQESGAAADLKEFMQDGLSPIASSRIALEAECRNLARYVTLFEKYLGAEMAVSFDFPVKPNDFLIPPFFLFPLVQHAFYYGYHADKKQPVRIKGKLVGDMLSLEVSSRVNHHLAVQHQSELLQYFRSRMVYEYDDACDLILNSNSYTSKATLRIRLKV